MGCGSGGNFEMLSELGKIDAMEKNQGNMWTWFISIGALAIAWFKGV
jgi:hypothetical protein